MPHVAWHTFITGMLRLARCCFGATLAYETVFCQRRTCLAQRHAGRELVRACRKPNPIIHRDLKPGNLLLSGGQYQDQLQIVFDTGMVKLVRQGATGVPAYVQPEPSCQ